MEQAGFISEGLFIEHGWALKNSGRKQPCLAVLQNTHAPIVVSNDHRVGEPAREQAAFNHAGDGVDRCI